MPRNIFISYRREENRYQARMIFNALQKTSAHIFYDFDSIPLGQDFKKIIMDQVQKCDVLLALVGRSWATCLDPKTGLRRLDNADDFVRIEIGTALDRGIPVVPVLLDDASLPETDQLPNDLRSLFDRQAEFISFRTFDDDVKRLITKLTTKSKQQPEQSEIPNTERPLGDRVAGYNFIQLADSLLAPGWAWVMARSWMFRACVLALGGVIFLAWYTPEIVRENYRLGISTLKVATNYEGHIPLDKNLSSTTKRLEKTLKADLSNLEALVPWATAQAIVAVEEGEQRTRPGYAQNAISLIRSNKTGECFCWAEIPKKDTDEVVMVIAGWVMLAFSHLEEKVSDSEVAYILTLQKAEGWWPIFRDKTDAAFASTYATAWIVLGLAEMSKRELISAAMRPEVEDAVVRGVSWLYKTRAASGKWKPYPNMAGSEESYSISGLVLHTLHVADASGLHDLDRNWLSGLPRDPPELSDNEQPRPELGGPNFLRIDTYVQIKLPWMLIATVDAYPNGTIFQKARAYNWIKAALSKRSVLTADANTENWKRAELLYALKYVRNLAAKKS